MNNPKSRQAIQSASNQTEQQGSYQAVRFNALKHGILSRHTVLPHEDADEYTELLAMLMEEHQPVGMTEAHLVEELAGIIWRKRRLLQAEAANINQGLKQAASNAEQVVATAAPLETGLSGQDIDLQALVRLTPEQLIERQREATQDIQATQQAIKILQNNNSQGYEKALQALRPDFRKWWQELVDDLGYPDCAEALLEFLTSELAPYCQQIEAELRHHAAIKEQTLGAGLQVHQLNTLSRYETHLDRKFERTLGMLVKLRALRA